VKIELSHILNVNVTRKPKTLTQLSNTERYSELSFSRPCHLTMSTWITRMLNINMKLISY